MAGLVPPLVVTHFYSFLSRHTAAASVYACNEIVGSYPRRGPAFVLCSPKGAYVCARVCVCARGFLRQLQSNIYARPMIRSLQCMCVPHRQISASLYTVSFEPPPPTPFAMWTGGGGGGRFLKPRLSRNFIQSLRDVPKSQISKLCCQAVYWPACV